ncbi:MAG: hypothetical protein R3338_05695 [Thermoanaerobaculia bacterium]|nr:hypothetical protein [Thermoanaerobaculia bacterium]
MPSLFPILASVAPGFVEALLKTMVVGVIAFGVCGALLAGFIRSLLQESDEGEMQFTARSGWWMAGLIASLLVFSIAFMWFGLGWD